MSGGGSKSDRSRLGEKLTSVRVSADGMESCPNPDEDVWSIGATSECPSGTQKW